MANTIGSERTLGRLLADLIRLDFDAAAAYQAAIARLDNPAFKIAMRTFRGDHLRHIRELGECLRDMGHRPPRQGDMKHYLVKGKVVLGGLFGDRAILRAMRTNEDDTVAAYDRAVKHKDCPKTVLHALGKAQKDEHRHREWIVGALKAKTTKPSRRPTSRRGVARAASPAKPRAKPHAKPRRRAAATPKRRSSRR